MFYVLLGVLLSCEEVEKPKVQVVDLRPRVRTAAVESKAFSRPIQLTATLQAHQSAVLVPTSPGRVSTVHVQIGDDVAEGAMLLEIEDADYQAAYQEAKAAMDLAQLQAKHAQVQGKRFATLFAEKAVTEYQLEEMRLNTELAEGQALRANAGSPVDPVNAAEARATALLLEAEEEESGVVEGWESLPDVPAPDHQ